MAKSPAEASGEVRDVALTDALSQRYLAYALSTIMSRSLPDLRDGLKPVHRRLLYAMRQLRLDPGTPYKKAARVVGDVIGKFHPHGDQSIYDALVRLAQDFALRYPLIDGQGNFGNIDGDNAAAMRYTEARLTEVAALLLQDIDADTVDFRPTYDGEAEEPVLLPAAFPNLLANGAQGIAVGMATSIPPHNVAELCQALLLLIDDRETPLERLLQEVHGPDFPTGGVLVEAPSAVAEAYRTGRGSFRLRARWEVETLKGGGYRIIVTEIPFQVQKARLVERLADLMLAKKLVLLGDVQDESTADVRLVLEPKSRAVDPAVLMESLFRQTDLEVRIPLNMNVLDGQNTPRVMGLREVMLGWLDHREIVLQRRTRHRLARIAERLEVLSGYIVAYLNLDEVIRIIREEDEPKRELMRTFELTDPQAEAILNMRLRSLRRLEEMELRREHEKLSRERDELEALLGSDRLRRRALSAEIKGLLKTFGPNTPLGCRRTRIDGPPAERVVPIEAVIEREPITVLLSEKGWIRALRGHPDDVSDAKYKEGDRGAFVLRAQTTDRLLLLSNDGRFYTLAGDRLPGGRGFGEPLRLMIDLPNESEVVSLFAHDPQGRRLLAASDGKGFIVKETDLLAQTKSGKQVLNLGTGARAVVCRAVGAEDDHVAVTGNNRKLLVFPLEELPEMAKGRGVTLQRYKDGSLADARTFRLSDGLVWTAAGGRQRREIDLQDWLGHRAQAGRLAPHGFPRDNRFDQ